MSQIVSHYHFSTVSFMSVHYQRFYCSGGYFMNIVVGLRERESPHNILGVKGFTKTLVARETIDRAGQGMLASDSESPSIVSH